MVLAGHHQVVQQQETEADQTAHRIVPCKMHTQILTPFFVCVCVTD